MTTHLFSEGMLALIDELHVKVAKTDNMRDALNQIKELCKSEYAISYITAVHRLTEAGHIARNVLKDE